MEASACLKPAKFQQQLLPAGRTEKTLLLEATSSGAVFFLQIFSGKELSSGAQGIKKVYLFTDSRLIVLFDEDLEIFDQIKYHIVKNIREDKNNILINLPFFNIEK